MEVTAHDAFMAMYYALEAATDNYSDQGLRTLVQDCNPFVWKDRLSADPAVWAEFSEAYSGAHGGKAITAEKARAFCRDWLAAQEDSHEFYRGPLVEAFDSVASPQDWEMALGDVRDNS